MVKPCESGAFSFYAPLANKMTYKGHQKRRHLTGGILSMY